MKGGEGGGTQHKNAAIPFLASIPPCQLALICCIFSQLAVQHMGAGMPFTPLAAPQQMAPGYMMYASHQQAMGGQHAMMQTYGFPPGMTPVPMMTHPRTAQQGDPSCQHWGKLRLPAKLSSAIVGRGVVGRYTPK